MHHVQRPSEIRRHRPADRLRAGRRAGRLPHPRRPVPRRPGDR
ncbi:hypothetical protein SCATT_55150 [Streptantibioticus cattleyicolor NRRL 8057 = DSM 46488]|uniref:Uncharacterized protein n=1 Tax=Streptantibioticus cattleyicolor (strain ATCC 35852 / DSM 46488 / JCM 4925 / NBRC 14057 / NRRL 8057) TaxID=1003195 RepID=G8WYB2_STREN|nr:hypothetical protein SCATT_55150 [Streptantibioticus cattleyicolor NRRL 8057 = DSM 46488]